jgi:hypothetical protein
MLTVTVAVAAADNGSIVCDDAARGRAESGGKDVCE